MRASALVTLLLRPVSSVTVTKWAAADTDADACNVGQGCCRECLELPGQHALVSSPPRNLERHSILVYLVK